jgi:uncharacterized YigZ family protein
MDTFKTISGKSEGLFKNKGSRFVAFAFPVKTEEEAKEILIRIKKEHHSARHHCFAWRIGTDEITWRTNDDGEPSSTAGKPILGQLVSFDVTNVLIVVVRYFGGTLLGTGGLTEAYRSSAAEALKNALIVTETIEEHYRLAFHYNEMNTVMQLMKQENLTITGTRFEMDCELCFSVRKSKAEHITEMLCRVNGIRIEKIY